MNKRTLTTVALIAGALAIVGGVWGLIEKVDGNNPKMLEETFMWIAIDLVLLGVAAVCLALAARSDR